MTRLKFIIAILLFNFIGVLNAQEPSVLKKTPVWKITVDKKEVKVGDEVEITFESIIEKNWYMYSSDMNPELGPIIASFTFTKHTSFSLVGKLKAIGSKKHYEDIWKGDVSIFTGKALFKQKVKILSDKPVIKGSMEFQECSEVTGVCMPPFDQEFEVKIAVSGSQSTGNSQQPTTNTQETVNGEPSTVNKIDTVSQIKNADTSHQQILTSSNNQITKSPNQEESFFGFLIFALIGGLIAVLTPCVFPMLPMTVSFFTKKSESRSQGLRRAFIFGACIVAIYASLGLVFAFLSLIHI